MKIILQIIKKSALSLFLLALALGSFSFTQSRIAQAAPAQDPDAVLTEVFAIPIPDFSTVRVTILKYVDGSMATAENANNTDFPMSATWNAANIGAGSGEYVLSENGFGGDPTPYRAITSDMSMGADYTTSETMGTEIGASCKVAGTEYSLLGYAYGDTLAEAQSAETSLVAPSFTDMKTDKFVIVSNEKCTAGNTNVDGDLQGTVVSGNGILEVTSIEMTDTSATANNTFEDGWEYVFHITVPSDETDLSMKFADWARTGGDGIIPAGNNMRISSQQANNGGATILITAANTYSTPPLTMVTDLNPALDGVQVRVTVEMKIPTGTPNGSYTTNYGVRSE